jgi:RHS repeat-associated protein
MGDIHYTYDPDGNLLSEKSLIKSKTYEYTDTNRMKSSVVSDTRARTISSTQYAYDAFGRRTVVQDTGSEAMRTLYDGLSFDVIRNSVTFNDGSFTSNYSRGSAAQSNTNEAGNRYRYIADSSSTDKTARDGTGDYTINLTRYTGFQTPLFANGESVAMSSSAQNNSSRNGQSQNSPAAREGSSYFGSDLMGSTRSSTNDYGSLEDRYEYDAFGTPYSGDFSTGLQTGYTGKPYDPITGLYNYGYRDYASATARFTTVDPVRDGNNWFAYVNNDPVNFMDEFGLSASEKKISLSINETRKKNLEFAAALRDIVGTPYLLGGTSKKGVDCSGTIGLALASMGYKNVPDFTASEMAAGKAPYITVNKKTKSENQGSAGMINFYTWDEENGVEHVNVGVGKQGKESINQVVDATLGGWMTSRNSNTNQLIPAKKDTVNITYSAYSSNTKPSSQGQINWSALEAYK